MQRCTRDLKKEMEKTRTCPNLVTHSYPKFELSTWNGFVNKQTYNIAMLIAFSSIARSLSGTTNIIKSYLTHVTVVEVAILERFLLDFTQGKSKLYNVCRTFICL